MKKKINLLSFNVPSMWLINATNSLLKNYFSIKQGRQERFRM